MKNKKRFFDRSKEECHIIALRYTEVTLFRRENQNIYSRARRQGWIADITSHMIRPRKGEVSKEECQTAAIKYKSKSEFEREDGFLYRKAKKNKWLNEICSHMIPSRIEGRSKEDCHKIALKYFTRTEFFTKSRSVYYISAGHGWLDDICTHMHSPNVKSNVLYMWNVKNTNVWKFGVSNEAQVNERIDKVSKRNGVNIGEKLFVIRDDARQCESMILDTMKNIPDMKKKDGHTEFRVLNDDEIKYAKQFFVESYQYEE